MIARQFDKLTAEYFDISNSKSKDLIGIVRIGASSSHLRPFVLPALAPLARKNPNVHFEIAHAPIQQIEQLLLDFKIDFAMTDRKVPTTKNIEYLAVGEEKYVVIRPLDASNEDKFLGTVPSDPTFNQFMTQQKKSLRPKREEMTFLGDVHSIIDAVRLGFGSSIVPEHMLGENVNHVKIDDRFTPVSHPFYLAYLRQPFLSTLEKEVITAFKRAKTQ